MDRSQIRMNCRDRTVILEGSVPTDDVVRWGVARSIVMAWVLTFPMAGLVAAFFYWVAHFFLEVLP